MEFDGAKCDSGLECSGSLRHQSRTMDYYIHYILYLADIASEILACALDVSTSIDRRRPRLLVESTTLTYIISYHSGSPTTRVPHRDRIYIITKEVMLSCSQSSLWINFERPASRGRSVAILP